jgi:hypothetical protein
MKTRSSPEVIMIDSLLTVSPRSHRKSTDRHHDKGYLDIARGIRTYVGSYLSVAVTAMASRKGLCSSTVTVFIDKNVSRSNIV